MKLRRLQSRWVRLGIALIVCAIVDWILWKRVSADPVVTPSRLEELLVAPGTFLGIVLSNRHGGPVDSVIMWTTTSLIVVSICYGLLALTFRILGDKS